MSPLSITQLRGVKDLIHDTVSAGVDAIEETHQAIARQSFAVLEQIAVIATPARAIGHIQQTVTGGVYQGIRTINLIAGTVATQVLDKLEQVEQEAQAEQPARQRAGGS